MIARDEDYLEYIRGLPCYICSADSEPHHVLPGGTGLKGSDYGAVPLCHIHHREVHLMGVSTFAKNHDISFDTMIVQTLIPYLDQLYASR